MEIRADAGPRPADAVSGDLLARLRLRDQSAIRTVIQRYNRRLYRIARSILRDDVEAEDAVQDAYVNAFTHLDSFRGDAEIGTWLCRIVINEATGRLRRRRSMVEWSTMDQTDTGAPSPSLAFGGPPTGPEETAARHELQRFLEEAIDRLPDDFRVVLMARVVEAMSVEETAACLDIRPETVKTRLHRARRMLRAAVESRVGATLADVFPFEDPRCERMAEGVLIHLSPIAGNL